MTIDDYEWQLMTNNLPPQRGRCTIGYQHIDVLAFLVVSFWKNHHFVLVISATQKVGGAFGGAFDQYALHLANMPLVAFGGVLC